MKNPEQFLSELKSAGLLRVLRDVECLPGGMARLADGRKVVNNTENILRNAMISWLKILICRNIY